MADEPLTPAERVTFANLPRPKIPGPWRWAGYIGGSIEIRTAHSGQLVVMGAQRAGMQGAQPTFQVIDPEHAEGPPSKWWGLMHRADELAKREVAYRDDIVSIENPEARLIVAAPEIRDAVDRLLEALGAAEARAERAEEAERGMRAALESLVLYARGNDHVLGLIDSALAAHPPRDGEGA